MTQEILDLLAIYEFKLHSSPVGGMGGVQVGVVRGGAREGLGWFCEEEKVSEGEQNGNDQLKEDGCFC